VRSSKQLEIKRKKKKENEIKIKNEKEKKVKCGIIPSTIISTPSINNKRTRHEDALMLEEC
jgi:hypothetical protein